MKKHAIIGCGSVAPNHVFGARFANPDVVLICCDININKAKAFAEKLSITETHKDYKKILKDDSVDSVSICTDHSSHAQITIDCLNAGKHVIVEKPIALSISDSKNMIAASELNNRILSVISQHRYTPEIQYIINLIKSGIFGEIATINGTLNSHKDNNYYTDSYWRGTLNIEGGSTLINQSIHTLDLMIHIMGQPENISAYQANLKFKNLIETEDTLAGIFKFSNGALGTILCTNASSKFWDSKIEVVAAKGNISFTTGFPVKVTNLYLDDPSQQKKIEQKIYKFESEAAEAISPSQDYYGISHKYQIKNFFNAINKTESLKMPPTEAQNTLKTVLDIYESSRNNNLTSLS